MLKTSDSQIVSLEKALLSLDREGVTQLIRRAADSDSRLHSTIKLVVGALDRIGNGWEKGEYSLSQVYLSGILCEEAVDEILPPKSPQRTDLPKMAIGVFEDFHLLGKRIVYSALRAGGYELIDLGSGLKAPEVISRVLEEKIEILLLSTLMLPSALKIREVTTRLKDTPVKIIVGGAPFRFDKELWKEVGAYATGRDSSEALMIIKKLTGGEE